MKKEQIIEMAKQAGFGDSYPWQAQSLFEAFAQLVADHALEEAAKKIEAFAFEAYFAPDPRRHAVNAAAEHVRAMKGKP